MTVTVLTEEMDTPRMPSRIRRWLTRRRVLLGAVVLTIGSWFGGLLWFGFSIPADVDDPDGRSDAIVVLTGGKGRIQTGFELLLAERGSKLFVSGVYRGVEVHELIRLTVDQPEPVECCVVLGYEADDTFGNALETAQWIRGEAYGSLRLVTANYHMLRSASEFRRAMPEIRISLHPVVVPDFKARRWYQFWEYPGTTYLVLSEYTKLLLSHLRDVGFWARDVAASAMGARDGGAVAG